MFKTRRPLPRASHLGRDRMKPHLRPCLNLPMARRTKYSPTNVEELETRMSVLQNMTLNGAKSLPDGVADPDWVCCSRFRLQDLTIHNTLRITKQTKV